MATVTPASNSLAAYLAEPRTRLVAVALYFLGTDYVWGGDLPDDGVAPPGTRDDGGAGSRRLGLDCSGLIVEVLTRCGLAEPGFDARAADFARVLPAVGFDAQPGDLAFFGGSAVSHVEMVLGGGGFHTIGARGGDRTTASVKEARRRGAKVTCGRWTRRDFLAWGSIEAILTGAVKCTRKGLVRS